jgi:hypothetical protein
METKLVMALKVANGFEVTNYTIDIQRHLRMYEHVQSGGTSIGLSEALRVTVLGGAESSAGFPRQWSSAWCTAARC